MKRKHSFTLMAAIASLVFLAIGFVAYKPETKLVEPTSPESSSKTTSTFRVRPPEPLAPSAKRLYPLDEELISKFAGRKADLEKIVVWSKKDFQFLMKAARRVNPNSKPNSKEISKIADQIIDRRGRKEYHRLLKRASVEFVLPQPPSYNNYFLCVREPDPGDRVWYTKGYAYCPESNFHPKMSSLDGVDNPGITLRSIEGNWFVFAQIFEPKQPTNQRQTRTGSR